MARAWSGTFDEMIGGHIERFCKTYFSMNSPGLAQYPDFFAVCLILLLSGETVVVSRPLGAVSSSFRNVQLLSRSHAQPEATEKRIRDLTQAQHCRNRNILGSSTVL